MAKKTAEELIDFAKSKIGVPYIFGSKGTKMSLSQIENLRKLYGHSMIPLSDNKKADKVCVDCSGLISWFTGIVRNSTGYKDSAIEIIGISKRSNQHIGWGIWMQGHIGIYLGDDQYIAADGSAYGVRIAKLSQNKFTHLLKLCDIDYTGKSTNQNINISYCVKTKDYGWLEAVNNIDDYAGWKSSPIVAIAMKVNHGRIEYQVHLKGQPKDKWLPKVDGYNINDVIRGYAGDGKSIIDCIKINYYTPDDIRPYKAATYQVNDLNWQHDTETNHSQNGYAGVYDITMIKLRISIQ